MCHGSDVLPGQSAISDSDLLLDSTFCEKKQTGFPVFWYRVPTVQSNRHGSDVSLCQSAISDSDLLLDSTFCGKKQISQFFCTVDLLFSAGAMDPDVSPCSKLSDFGEEKTNKTKRGMHV